MNRRRLRPWPARTMTTVADSIPSFASRRRYTPNVLHEILAIASGTDGDGVSTVGDPRPTEPLSVTEAGSAVRLAERYRLGPELSRGGIGIVYRATDERMPGRPVVIKVLQTQCAERAWVRRKFEDE